MTYIPEGLTIIFEAPQRFGKTLGMVAMGLDAFHKGRNIFSNIQIGFPHEPLQFKDIRLEDGTSKFWNGHVLIDELNFYFDARRSMSGPNVEFGAYLLQQKKQGCNITGTTHGLEYLDVRLRQNYDYLIHPSVYPAYPETPEFLRLHIENGPLQRPMKRTLVLPCGPYLSLYDTKAVYDPFKETNDEDSEELPRKRRRKRLSID